MSHQETFRSEDGGSSRFEIRNAAGDEMIAAQRDRDLMRVWVRAPGVIDNEDALALGDWLTEARPWAEGRRR